LISSFVLIPPLQFAGKEEEGRNLVHWLGVGASYSRLHVDSHITT
jgi:hypothetical protein